MNTSAPLAKARIALLATVFGMAASPAAAQNPEAQNPAAQNPVAQNPASQALPTGQMLTPLAAPGATFEPLVAHTGPLPDTRADGAAAIAVNPDGSEMLVLTSGFNRIVGTDGKVIAEQSGEYVFRYAIDAAGSRLVQTLTVPNAYSGVAWTPDGKGILVGGGESDTVYRFDRSADGFHPGSAIRLGHKAGNGVEVKPEAAGVAVSPDGTRVYVAGCKLSCINGTFLVIDATSGTVLSTTFCRWKMNSPASTITAEPARICRSGTSLKKTQPKMTAHKSSV